MAKGKAPDLMERLTRDLPHLARLTGVQARFEPGANIDWDRLRQSDLIVATTGDWACDGFLNELQQAGVMPPVLYAWVEANAAAAHVVYVPPDGACLRCGVTSTGAPLLPATRWQNNGQVATPACGGAFTPYGAADLSWAHSLVASEALKWLLSPGHVSVHRVWLGDTARIAQLGGTVTDEWRQAFGDPGTGSLIRERPWPHAAHCPVCGAQAEAA